MITTAPISSAGLPQLIESRLVTVRLRLSSLRGSLSMAARAHCRTSSRLLRDAVDACTICGTRQRQQGDLADAALDVAFLDDSDHVYLSRCVRGRRWWW